LEKLQHIYIDLRGIIVKICNKCKEEYPATLEYFYKQRNCQDGLYSWCKICDNLRTKKYQKENKSEIKNYNKKWYQENKDQKIQYSLNYNQNHKENCIKANKKYTENHPESKRFQAFIRKKYIKQATPKNKEILKQLKELKKTCPKDFHLHHIVPIKENKNIVMGLNVPWNIKTISEKEHKEIHYGIK